MSRTRAHIVATVLVALALLSLAVTTTVAMFAISNANARVAETRAVVATYTDLQVAVAAEAFAEAGYRRAPSPEARERLEDAIANVDVKVGAVRAVGGREDGAVLSYLTVLNRRYVSEVRSTLDTPSAQLTDDRVAGPALDAIGRLLDAAVGGHRAEVNEATNAQAATIERLGWILAAVFAIVFGVLARTWRMMMVEQRRLRHEAADSETRASTDPLTGLANRDFLRRRMDEALAVRGARSALLFLDLDRFKPVNDTYGHHAGDLMLQAVAQRIMAIIRSGDVAARLGGDEFAVFLPGGTDARLVADRILAAMELPFWVEGVRVEIGVSIGIARAPEDGIDAPSLLREADAALYEAKRRGRGRAYAHSA